MILKHHVMQRTPGEGINIARELCGGPADMVLVWKGTSSFIGQHD